MGFGFRFIFACMPHLSVFSIVVVDFVVRPLQDIPVSSSTYRFTKQLLANALPEDSVVRALLIRQARVSEKPLKVSFLMSGGSYVWSPDSEHVVLSGGVDYGFRVVFVDSELNSGRLGFRVEAGSVIDELLGVRGVFTVYGAFRVSVEPVGASVINSGELGVGLVGSDYVKVSFQTPTLLQYPKHPRLGVRESVHALYPHPVLLMLSLIRRWNAYERFDKVGLSHAIYAPYELREVNHSIRPVTISVGKTRTRGFIGWLILRPVSRSEARLRNYMKLLDMANYLGVGRSTSIGLGAVKVTPIRLGNA